MLFRREHDPAADDATDAIVDADRTYRRGTAGAALRHRNFRLVWGGTFLSNIGTWMQNVILGVFAYKISNKDAGYVGLIYFAQLGPLLFLSQIGGVIADQVNRRRFLVAMQTMQMVFSFLLVPLAVVDHPNLTAVFLCVLVIGIFNALERAGDGRDPPDPRTARGPPRCGVAAVGADEPLARHRIRDRRRAVRRARHRLGLRHQRGHVSVRGRRAGAGPLRRPQPESRPGQATREGVLGREDRVERPPAATHLHHDVHVLVLLADVRRPVPRRRVHELRDLRAPEARLRTSLRHVGARRGARRAHGRYVPRRSLEGRHHTVVAGALRGAAHVVRTDPVGDHGLRGGVPARLRVLPRHHVALDGSAGAPRRLRSRVA